MSVSTLPAAGGLDVNELSHKLSTIPALTHLPEQDGEEREEEEEEEEVQMTNSETSSTAAMFGSEIGMYVCVYWSGYIRLSLHISVCPGIKLTCPVDTIFFVQLK